MSNLIATADRLRAVRKAREHFLTLWTLDCLLKHTQTTQRLLADIRREPADLNSFPIMSRFGDLDRRK